MRSVPSRMMGVSIPAGHQLHGMLGHGPQAHARISFVLHSEFLSKMTILSMHACTSVQVPYHVHRRAGTSTSAQAQVLAKP